MNNLDKKPLTVKDLYEHLGHHAEMRPSDLEREVVVEVAKPSIGPRASVGVESIYFGFDWEANQFILCPNIPLTPKTENEQIWDDARELLMWIATKPVKKESYEVREARRILERLKIDYMKYQKILHREIEQ